MDASHQRKHELSLTCPFTVLLHHPHRTQDPFIVPSTHAPAHPLSTHAAAARHPFPLDRDSGYGAGNAMVVLESPCARLSMDPSMDLQTYWIDVSYGPSMRCTR